MNTTKIIIGSGILIGAAGIAYFLVKRSQQAPPVNNTGSSSTPVNTGTTTPAVQRVSKYPEGTLLRAGNEAEVYLIDAEGYRHYITSRAAFDRMRLNMADVKSVSTAEVLAVPRLQDLSGLGILF